MRFSALLAVAAAIVVVLAGCGSGGGSSANTGASAGSSGAGSAVARAADVTGSSSGYQFESRMSITGASSLKATVSGTILGSSNRGELAVRESVLGHSLNISERYSGRTYWLSASGVPGASTLTSKPWLKYSLASTLTQLGVGGLPSGGSNPTQFLTYLKAGGASAQKLGRQTIGGVATTHYAVAVNLDDYARRVPTADRAAARKTIQRLISTIGSNTLHVQVWIDHHDLARRLYLSFPECVAQQHLHLGLTMDLFDFGTQATVTLPTQAQSYDITSLVDRELANQKVGCTAS